MVCQTPDFVLQFADVTHVLSAGTLRRQLLRHISGSQKITRKEINCSSLVSEIQSYLPLKNMPGTFLMWQIYLVGFSRGAYQVRALAGMIHKVDPSFGYDMMRADFVRLTLRSALFTRAINSKSRCMAHFILKEHS